MSQQGKVVARRGQFLKFGPSLSAGGGVVGFVAALLIALQAVAGVSFAASGTTVANAASSAAPDAASGPISGSAPVVSASASPAAGPFALTILHTNDQHAHLASFDKYGRQCAPGQELTGECRGGSARVASAVARERVREANVILLDAGDQFQGTLFFTVHRGRACAALMNLLDYDAMTLGNHEFDEGSRVLADFLRLLQFPALAANMSVADASPLAGLVRPWTVLDVRGRRVGVIGAAHPETPMMSSPGPGLAFADPVPAVRRAVEALSRRAVDIVVVLSHLGLDGDRRLAEQVSGLDVIVGGHSHLLLANTVAGAAGPCPLVEHGPDRGVTLIVTAGFWSAYLGRLRVVFDARGRAVSWTGEPVALDASVRPDPVASALVERLAEPLRAAQARVLGETRATLPVASCRTGECLPGDLRAEALLEATRGQGTSAALVNAGSVRSDIPAGPIRYGTLQTVYPFADKIVVVSLSGAALRVALEHGLSALGTHDGTGRFLQVAGLRYVFDSSAPAGRRLREVFAADADGAYRPLDDAVEYRVAVSNYLLRGGDGYAVFRERGRLILEGGPDPTEATEAYLRAHTPLSLDPDGRIRDLAAH